MMSYSMAKGASVKMPKGAWKSLMGTDTEHNCHTVSLCDHQVQDPENENQKS